MEDGDEEGEEENEDEEGVENDQEEEEEEEEEQGPPTQVGRTIENAHQDLNITLNPSYNNPVTPFFNNPSTPSYNNPSTISWFSSSNPSFPLAVPFSNSVPPPDNDMTDLLQLIAEVDSYNL